MKVGDYCYIKGISRDYGIGKITQLNSGYSSNGGTLVMLKKKYNWFHRLMIRLVFGLKIERIK